MSLPNDRRYAKTHEWVLPEGEEYLVGITDHAQEQLGDVVYVGDFQVGATLQAGDVAGLVESVKAASDIFAPIAGTITAVNEAVIDAPELLNEEAYEAWIYRLRPDNTADWQTLLEGHEYDAVKDES